MSKSNFQRPNKSQISISNDPNKCAFFLNLSHCDLFVFCHLKFGIFHTSIRASSSIKLAAFRARGEAEPFFPVPPSAVCRPAFHPPPSIVCHLPSAVCRPPPAFHFHSTFYPEPHTLHPTPFLSLHRQPSALCRSPSTLPPSHTSSAGSPSFARRFSMRRRISTAAFSGSGSTANVAPTTSSSPSVSSFTTFMLPVIGGIGPKTV